jgi:predicted DsbA family dithiol-disulfide isomerase
MTGWLVRNVNPPFSVRRSQRNCDMRIKATNYLDVISSWCYWAEPAWAELKKRYEHRNVDFEWKIALMDRSGLPASREQHEWFYRRSGTMMRSPFKLSVDWANPELSEYLAPNCVAKAAEDLGVQDDRVRLAISHAALREGKQVGDWHVAAKVGALAAGLDAAKLLERAQSSAIEAVARANTAEFHALQVTQRPTFVFNSDIGDRAVFSGFARLEPLTAALDSMLDDIAFYQAHGAHFGVPPP